MVLNNWCRFLFIITMRIEKAHAIILLTLIGYTIYHVWLNWLFPFINDDYFYQYIVMYNLDHPVQSVKDIIQSQYLHYHNINGRSIIHAFEQFVLLLSPDKQLFNILNAVIWTALLCLIVTYAVPDKERSWVHWFIAIIYLRFLSANSSYLAFWASGSFNYYWASVFIILFLFIYRRNQPKCAIYLYPIYFLLSVLIGWSHETIITGVIAAVVVEYIVQKQYKNPLHTVIVAGLLIGYTIMFFAPGNFVKLDAVKSAGGTSFFILALATASQFKMVFVLLIMLIYGYISHRKDTLDYIISNRFLIIASMINMLSCIIIGVGGRAIFFAETLAVILILRYLSTFIRSINTAPVKWCIPVLVALIAYEACYAHDWKKIYGEIDSTIQSYIENSDSDYIVSDIYSPMPITAHTILSSNDFWINHYNFGTLSAIHNKTFRIIPSTIYQAIKDGTLCDKENRLANGLEFYTTDSIDWLVMPCDTIPPCGQYTFNLCKASPSDPDINFLGKLRRKIAPDSYPSTYTPGNYSANPSEVFTIDNMHYIILQKPPYRQVESVYFVPEE